MLNGALKPKAEKQVQRHIAIEGLRLMSVTAANTGMPNITNRGITYSAKQSYGNKSADQYLRKQHQKAAIERLPYWMDGVNADIGKAKRHVNCLYRWVLALAFILGVMLCVSLVLVWQMVGGAI